MSRLNFALCLPLQQCPNEQYLEQMLEELGIDKKTTFTFGDTCFVWCVSDEQAFIPWRTDTLPAYVLLAMPQPKCHGVCFDWKSQAKVHTEL